MGREWCELCQRWETEEQWTRKHVRSLGPAEVSSKVRPLTPEEEAARAAALERLKRERRAMIVPPPVTWPTPRPELVAVAERVRRLRKDRGLSQSALARSLGVEVLSVKRWEAGRVQPRQKILKRLEELETSLGGSPRG